jgi:hypothetical protein
MFDHNTEVKEKKNGSRIRKKTFYLQFAWRFLKTTKKIKFYASKVKKTQKFLWGLSDGVCNPK